VPIYHAKLNLGQWCPGQGWPLPFDSLETANDAAGEAAPREVSGDLSALA